MKYVGFLRGINVGGHHKVPMAELRTLLGKMGYGNVETLLNSGNIIFESDATDAQELELVIEEVLLKTFGFAIPVVIRTHQEICELVEVNPFKELNIHPDIRLYVTFLKSESSATLTLPYISPDQSFRILSVQNRIVCSVLDLSVINTPKGMDDLEKLFGKNITTRNWNTLSKIALNF